MQATGQYGVVPDVPQYVGSRVAPPHGHMFNLSHEISLSPSSHGSHTSHGHGHGLSLSSPSPHSQQQQQQQQQQQNHHHMHQLNHPHLQQQAVLSQHHHHHQQPQFIQSQSHQQTQHGFDMSMNAQKPPPPQQNQPRDRDRDRDRDQPQQSQALQSAAQQVQADIYHHQQQQKQRQQGDHVQQNHQVHQLQQQTTLESDSNPPQLALNTSLYKGLITGEGTPQLALNTSLNKGLITGEGTPQALNSGLNKGLITGEESLDGEEQDEEGEKGGAGNRWPRQEAFALLKIRAEMDAVFRDSSLKGPLWEEISRKLAEMGHHRSAKKCKEKFENVHKYYKRTKDGKAGRQDGKSYRFFSQLEALYGKAGESNNSTVNLSNKSLNNAATHAGQLLNAANINGDNCDADLGLIAAAKNNNRPAFPSAGNTTVAAAAAATAHIARTLERVESIKHDSDNSIGLKLSYDSSEDDEFDGPLEARRAENPSSKKRKRKPVKKYMDFFQSVMKKVLDKQEQMQQKFLEAMERRDQERMIREEAWKRQEMAKLNSEHDLRAQERALSTSREESLVAFLQKITGQTLTLPHVALHSNHQPSSAIIPADYIQDDYPHDKDMYDPTSKRWPKPEVLALIKIRTSLDKKFHEPGSKAVLWEEISAGMASQGYSCRTAKRCKEKWENINKYFKKAKESNKERPENAKTCPYFHHLNALYKEGLLISGGGSNISSKQLMLIEKREEQSEDVPEQGNTSNNTREDSGQAQEGDSEILPTGEFEGPGLNTTPIAAAAAAATATATAATTTTTTAAATATVATAAPSITSASSDAAMYLFMSSDNRGNNANIKKAISATNDSHQPTNDVSASVKSPSYH